MLLSGIQFAPDQIGGGYSMPIGLLDSRLKRAGMTKRRIYDREQYNAGYAHTSTVTFRLKPPSPARRAESDIVKVLCQRFC